MHKYLYFRNLKGNGLIYSTFLALLINLSSCTTIQKVPPLNLGYFKTDSISTYPAYFETQKPEVTLIQGGDILAIVVNSLNIESNEILNFTTVNTLPVSVFSGNVGGGVQPLGYPVDSLGFVNIPLLGKVSVGGLSLQRAEEILKNELEKSIKSPVVNVRFMNHKFSMIGEVGSVGIFNLLDDNTTIIDAIALAGDLSMFAKRDSVVVIRNIGNVREMGIVNLRDRSVFSSPYFYIKNGDIIYISPDQNKILPETPYVFQPPVPTWLRNGSYVLGFVSAILVFISFFK